MPQTFILKEILLLDLKSYTENGLLSFNELAGVRARVTEAEMSIDIGSMKGNCL